jgi:hypothetical protein
MASDLHDINIALARCDLERLVRDHIHDGVEPGQLLKELLDMCVNLRELARACPETCHSEPAADSRASPVALLRPTSHRSGASLSGSYPVGNVRWLRPVDVTSGRSGHEDHVQSETDADQRLADDEPGGDRRSHVIDERPADLVLDE